MSPRPRQPAAAPEFPDVVGAQLLARSLRVVLYLREQQRPVSVAELSSELDLAPSNVYRVVRTLELSGLVERRGRGRIDLGLRLLDLGRAVDERIEIEVAPAALGVLRALTETTRETTLLTMPTGLQAIGILSVESEQPIRLSFARRRVLPLHAGASGKVLLPWLPARVLDTITRDADGWTLANGHILTPERLRAQVEDTRALGYCLTCGEVDADATAIAAPVFEGSRLFGGLTVAGPSTRFDSERLPLLATQVCAAARELARRLDARRFLDG